MTAMEIAKAFEVELINWAIGGGTLIVIALAVIGLCSVVKAVRACF